MTSTSPVRGRTNNASPGPHERGTHLVRHPAEDCQARTCWSAAPDRQSSSTRSAAIKRRRLGLALPRRGSAHPARCWCARRVVGRHRATADGDTFRLPVARRRRGDDAAATSRKGRSTPASHEGVIADTWGGNRIPTSSETAPGTEGMSGQHLREWLPAKSGLGTWNESRSTGRTSAPFAH